MKRLALVCSVTLTVAACATRPEDIKAAHIPDAAYSGKSCQELVAEREEITSQLEFDEKKQRQAATGDTVGVLLIGVPLSSMSGADRETEIAVAKGKQASIDRALKEKGC